MCRRSTSLISLCISLATGRPAIAPLLPNDSHPGHQIQATEFVTITTSTSIPSISVEEIPSVDERMIDALLEEGNDENHGTQVDDDVIITGVFQTLSGSSMHELEQKLETDVPLPVKSSRSKKKFSLLRS